MNRKDGTLISVLLNASKIRVQGKEFLQIRIQDITELKLVEDELRISEEKYRSLFEEAMDAIVVADVETGMIIDCNRAASELVGRKKSELIGKHQRILHPPQEIIGKFSRTFTRHTKEKEGHSRNEGYHQETKNQRCRN
jgi:PAS domain S-box-containing protein